MAVATDPAEKLQSYAHPERLVTTDWLAEHAGDPGLVIVESDEDVLLYETGHIPGAVKVDWHTDLQDPVARDYLSAEGFAKLLSDKGIARYDTIVFYGDNFNWWAAYALWVFSLFGHGDVRLLDGGRAKWIAEGRPITTDAPSRPAAQYPVVERSDEPIRAFRDDVLAHIRAGEHLVDVRSPEEYAGTKLHMPEYPQEGAMRGGHIPRRRQRALEEGGERGRQLQDDGRAPGHLRAGAGPLGRRRRHRLLPHRGALEPHLVRADGPARLRPRPQLRRLVDGVGQPGRAPIERPGLPVSPPM